MWSHSQNHRDLLHYIAASSPYIETVITGRGIQGCGDGHDRSVTGDQGVVAPGYSSTGRQVCDGERDCFRETM